jgi:hypothetical protein
MKFEIKLVNDKNAGVDKTLIVDAGGYNDAAKKAVEGLPDYKVIDVKQIELVYRVDFYVGNGVIRKIDVVATGGDDAVERARAEHPSLSGAFCRGVHPLDQSETPNITSEKSALRKKSA